MLLQAKILRVLQESTIERMEGAKTLHLDVLVIAAPSINLEEAVQQNRKQSSRPLALCGNNISQAAKLLEISRPTLHDLLKKYDKHPDT
jgi:two-component system NtrC family response regulator